jgi:ATP-dependent DNA helicase RecG
VAADLASPVQFVKGVGPGRAAALEKAGIATAEDLLLHLPMRYEDRAHFTRIADLVPGERATIAAKVLLVAARQARRMPILEARVEDDSGQIKVIWFNQPYLARVIERGKRLVLHGPVEIDRMTGRISLHSPQHEVLDEGEAAGVHMGRIVPVYEKVGPLTSRMLRRILSDLLAVLPEELPDPLPEAARAQLGVVGRARALREVHEPLPEADVAALNAFRSPAHLRLILEEFFLFQAGLALRRRRVRAAPKRVRFAVTDSTREAVKRILPFPLTGAQKRVLREIADDMCSPHPMRRLVQGDVGAGKTLVALLAMVVAAESGYQAAFMAPTEILAEQHYLSFRRLLARTPYQVVLLSGAAKGKARAATLAALHEGRVQFAVGTHALVQDAARFARLGLAVVDEQHRFGVLQREELARKGLDADLLVMTATPIPRTLALTAYGDLDASVIDERPPGRTPIRTLRRSSSERQAVVEIVARELAQGHQAYVVYPLVEETEKLEDVRAATEMAEEWRALLPGTAVGLLHGRLKSAEKEAVMGEFAAGKIGVLVATSVVEVGVDVANATAMVIEHAERFGLAQLHQLRGRVGRGRAPSTCVLVTHGHLTDEARSRVEALLATEDGFEIAARDLEIRGPGDVFGTRQWGIPSFRVGRLLRDRELLERSRDAALRHVEAMPPGDPFESALDEIWARRFRLAEVG